MFSQARHAIRNLPLVQTSDVFVTDPWNCSRFLQGLTAGLYGWVQPNYQPKRYGFTSSGAGLIRPCSVPWMLPGFPNVSAVSLSETSYLAWLDTVADSIFYMNWAHEQWLYQDFERESFRHSLQSFQNTLSCFNSSKLDRLPWVICLWVSFKDKVSTPFQMYLFNPLSPFSLYSKVLYSWLLYQ